MLRRLLFRTTLPLVFWQLQTATIRRMTPPRHHWHFALSAVPTFAHTCPAYRFAHAYCPPAFHLTRILRRLRTLGGDTATFSPPLPTRTPGTPTPIPPAIWREDWDGGTTGGRDGNLVQTLFWFYFLDVQPRALAHMAHFTRTLSAFLCCRGSAFLFLSLCV